jgi:hypothetical protein
VYLAQSCIIGNEELKGPETDPRITKAGGTDQSTSGIGLEVAQEVGHPLCKQKALSSKPNPTKNKQQKSGIATNIPFKSKV